MKKQIFFNLRNAIIAVSIAGLGLTSNAQAHYELDDVIPYYYFFYNLDYAPRHHHYNRGHLIKKNVKKHRHHRPHSHHRADHKHYRKSHSHDHYSRQKSRKHKQHRRDHRNQAGKPRLKKHDN